VLGPTDPRVQLADMRDLDLVVIGTEALIDDELVRIDAIDAVAGTLTIARDCVTVDAKLLTRTQQGTLDPALAPIAQLRLDARHARPYPPLRLRINGAAWPQTAFARLAIAWAHRDRVLQGDRLIEHEAGSIGPEPGTTTSVRIYHALSNTLLHTTENLSGTSTTYDLDLVNDTTIRVEVESRRGALASRQKHIRIIQCECGEKLANADFDTQAAWTLGAGWSIVSGVAIKTAGVASDLAQTIPLVAGALYRIELVLTQVTAGTVRVVFAGATPVDGVARNASGSFIETLTASAHTALRIVADAAFVGRIERVSLRRLA
jgi:hypothetical protein